MLHNNAITIPEIHSIVTTMTDNLIAIGKRQREFLEELHEAVGTEFLAVKTYPSPSQLRNSLLHLGGVFVNQGSKFKSYSSFCASHFKLQKLLQLDDNASALKTFVSCRSANSQNSATLESLLIKPVQRVLRYPLFLQQMKSLTPIGSYEHLQMSEALSKMEHVAEYINEMQRVYEEHGAALTTLQGSSNDPTISLDLSTLIMCGEVDWLNCTDLCHSTSPSTSAGALRGQGNGEVVSRSKRKQQDAQPPQCQAFFCFVFYSAIVLLSVEKQQHQQQQQSTSKISNNRKPSAKEVKAATLSAWHRLIPMREVEVNGSDLGSTMNQHIWILIHLDQSGTGVSEKVYHFANRQLEEKQQYLKAIRKAGLVLARDSARQYSPAVLASTTPQVDAKSALNYPACSSQFGLHNASRIDKGSPLINNLVDSGVYANLDGLSENGRRKSGIVGGDVMTKSAYARPTRPASINPGECQLNGGRSRTAASSGKYVTATGYNGTMRLTDSPVGTSAEIVVIARQPAPTRLGKPNRRSKSSGPPANSRRNVVNMAASNIKTEIASKFNKRSAKTNAIRIKQASTSESNANDSDDSGGDKHQLVIHSTQSDNSTKLAQGNNMQMSKIIQKQLDSLVLVDSSQNDSHNLAVTNHPDMNPRLTLRESTSSSEPSNGSSARVFTADDSVSARSSIVSGPNVCDKRPGSYHSNQSDAGYGSNGEMMSINQALPSTYPMHHPQLTTISSVNSSCESASIAGGSNQLTDVDEMV